MEEQILRNERETHTIQELADMLGRSFQAVAVKSYKIGLKKENYATVWTPEQLKILKEHYATMFNKPLAKWIGISMRTMQRKARELGLQKKPDFLIERKKDIVQLLSEAQKRSTKTSTRFKKGQRNNPSGEFKPGHKESAETRSKRIEALKHSWKIRKAKLELDKNLHPEKYY